MALPFVVRRAVSPVSVTNRGYQYEIGFENLVALDVQPTTTCVFVQGPVLLDGCTRYSRYLVANYLPLTG
jgi:hypothetical protein